MIFAAFDEPLAAVDAIFQQRGGVVPAARRGRSIPCKLGVRFAGAMKDEYVNVARGNCSHAREEEAKTAVFDARLAWAPLVLGLATCALFLLLQLGFDVNRYAVSQLAAEAMTRESEWDATIVAARTHWATGIFVATVIMVVLAGASITSIVQARPARGVVNALILAVPALFAIFHIWPNAIAPEMLREEMVAVAKASAFDPEPRLILFLSGLLSTALLLAVAVGLELKALSRGVPLSRLVAAQAKVKNALALTTLWLIVGVVGIGLFHRMAATCIVTEEVAALTALGNASTILSGAFYSALLAATFAPADLTLRWLAGSVSSSAEDAAEKGLDLSVAQSLVRVLAVFGPLLAGVVQNLAEFK